MSGRNTSSYQPHPQPQPVGHQRGHPQGVTYEVHLPTVQDDRRTYQYPCCECACTGPHSPDCMFGVYKQMTGNYKMTKDLMTQFINQMTKGPMDLEMERQFETENQEICRKFCQGKTINRNIRTDNGMISHSPPMVTSNLIGHQRKCGNKNTTMQRRQDGFGEGKMQDCMKMLMREGGAIGPESYNRKLIEDQRRTKNIWVQFMNIFDMALNLAADASNARWALNRQRKENERLACERRIEEARLEWCKKCCNKKLSTENSESPKKADDKTPEKDNHTKSNKSEKYHQPETKTDPQTNNQSERKAQPQTEKKSPKQRLSPKLSQKQKAKPETNQQSGREVEPEAKQNSPKPSPKPSPSSSVVSDRKSSVRVQFEEAIVDAAEQEAQDTVEEGQTEETTQ